jgi:hypothetical protein
VNISSRLCGAFMGIRLSAVFPLPTWPLLLLPDALMIITYNRFRGIQPAPIGLEYNFIKWYVPKDKQKYTMTR